LPIDLTGDCVAHFRKVAVELVPHFARITLEPDDGSSVEGPQIVRLAAATGIEGTAIEHHKVSLRGGHLRVEGPSVRIVQIDLLGGHLVLL
jgi:hypothetical protein